MRRGLVVGIVASVTAGGYALAACSGSASTGLFAGGDGAPSDGIVPEGTSGDGPPADGTGDDRIDPLVVGHEWIYDVKPIDGGTVRGCSVGVETSSVVSAGAAYDGSATVRYKPLCDNFLVDALVEGDRVTAFPVDAGAFQPGIVLDSPVEEGHVWSYTSAGPQFVWHNAGTVTTPAGTFPRCWARAYVTASAARFIYCRGVGLAQLEDPDNGYTAVLTSKNF
jgi:hypothetical protein